MSELEAGSNSPVGSAAGSITTSGGPAAPRPAPPRAHRRGDMRPTDVLGAFFLCGLSFMTAAAAAGVFQAIAPWPWGRWLALHLAFFGGVSQLVLGASQFFAGAFLATDPPPRRLVRTQLICWNLGSILLALAVPTRNGPLTWMSVALLLLGLGAWARALAAMRGRSLSKNRWATRWYESAGGLFTVGIVAGAMLADGISWPHGYLLGAHMVLNLAGWFGAAIVGTLHTFYPSLTQTTTRFPRLQAVTFWSWTGGVVALAVGYGKAIDPLAIAGWVLLAAASVALLVNVIACRIGSDAPLSLPARLVGAAQIFLPLGILALLGAALADGPAWSLAGSTRVAAGTALVAGWVGLTVMGSLLHLLAIVVRVRDFTRPMPRIRPRLDIALTAIAVISIGALATSQLVESDLAAVVRVVVLIAYAALAVKVALLGAGVMRHARPQV